MKTRVLVTAAVAAATLAAAGCGGSKSSVGTTTEAVTTQAAPTTTVAAATTTTSSSKGSGSFSSTKNCIELASLAAKVEKSIAPTGNGSVDLSKQADAMKALASAAPSAIKGDFQTFADAYASFAKAYGSAGIKTGSAPSAAQIAKLTAAAKSLSTPKVQAAMQHLEAWGKANCAGLTATTP
jgi:ABC-type Zn uptake system ZnuABC Zn-binding protein ZnuA